MEISEGGTPLQRRGVSEIVCKENPDVLIVQEMKRREIDRKFVGNIWKSRFKEWAYLPAVGCSGGILLIWDVRRGRVKVVGSFLGEFSVPIKVEEEEGEFWSLSRIYGPNHCNKRILFWGELAGLWLLCGPLVTLWTKMVRGRGFQCYSILVKEQW